MGKAHKGANELLKAFKAATLKEINNNVYYPVLGTIQNDMSLLLDDFPIPIPNTDYLISEHLILPQDYMTTTPENEGNHPHGPSGSHSQYQGDGIHTHPNTEGKHIHNVITPTALRPLGAGDRVLCIPVNGGSEYVITGRVVSYA